MARKLNAKTSVSDIVPVGEDWSASAVEAQSEAHLEDDQGEGDAAIIRMFEFAVNPEAFKQHTPTKQELFNSHAKGIEIMLWKDGMKVMPEVPPRVSINKKGTKYRIFIGAQPMKGHVLKERPQTLGQIVHGSKTNK